MRQSYNDLRKSGNFARKRDPNQQNLDATHEGLDNSVLLAPGDLDISILNETIKQKHNTSYFGRNSNVARGEANDKPKYGSVVTNMRKARILNATLKRIMNTNKQRAFMNMVGCNIRESRSGQEAGLRLKGRLLIMM